jgi:mono/diheme cytochrome c family protein
MRKHLLMATTLGIALFACASTRATASGAGDGDAVAGRHDFQDFGCSACHGTTGSGGGWQGPKLAPDPIPFEAFLAQLREPVSKMPRYSTTVLSDREAADLYAYLRGVPKGKSASQIKILQR